MQDLIKVQKAYKRKLEKFAEYYFNTGWITPEMVKLYIGILKHSDISWHVATAAYMLGKTGQTKHIRLLQQALAKNIWDSPNSVFQIMIALENLGEVVWKKSANRTAFSYSIREQARNLKTAEQYLKKIEEDL